MSFKEFVISNIRDIRSIIRELWIIAFILSFLALIIHNQIIQRNVLLSIGIAIGYGLAFALNDYYDRNFDEMNPKKAKRNYFVRSQFTKKTAIIIITIILVLLISIFAQFGQRGLIFMIFSIFVLWSYSSPPFRFKSKFILDLIIPAFFMHSYPYLLTLLILKLKIKQIDLAIISLLMISSVASQLEQQIRDFEYDAIVDINTSQIIGMHGAIRLMQFFTILLVVEFIIIVYLKLLQPYLIFLSSIYLFFIIPRFTDPKTGKNQIHSRIATVIVFSFLLLYIFANKQ